MRSTILVSALAALAAALPRPQDQVDDPSDGPAAASSAFPTPTVPLGLTTSFIVPVITPTGNPTPTDDPDATSTFHSRSRRPHWEPIPIFTKECTCNLATARYPCWATDSLQRCYYEENFSYGCYMEAAGGCPTPTRVCSALFQPTPRTGRHPCDLGPIPPVITDPVVSSMPTSVPAFPTLNVSMPVVPSGNASWSVRPSGNFTLPVVSRSANITLPVVSPTGSMTINK